MRLFGGCFVTERPWRAHAGHTTCPHKRDMTRNNATSETNATQATHHRKATPREPDCLVGEEAATRRRLSGAAVQMQESTSSKTDLRVG
mmetsp:Transcript_6962/g.13246  ORF Transcript_6962/g.13246 Transcript_6962/m.13246 type:complete len:89 (-) Transcript_6962:3877-4143(-)